MNIFTTQTDLQKRLFYITDNCYIKTLNFNKTPNNSTFNDGPWCKH